MIVSFYIHFHLPYLSLQATYSSKVHTRKKSWNSSASNYLNETHSMFSMSNLQVMSQNCKTFAISI